MTTGGEDPAAGDVDGARVGSVVARLSDDRLDRGERTRLLGTLTGLLAGGLRGAGSRAALTGQWLADLVADAAPHVPVRDLVTIREHHGGLSGDDLAESLVRTASRATAAVGAVGGTVSSVHALAPPSLVAAPLTLTAETLAVVAIELKLVAELHVVHGRAPVGSRAQVATAYLSSWAAKKGLDPTGGTSGLASVLGVAARHQLRSRVARRLGRNVSTLAPFLTGAVAGAELNRRETVKLGDALLRDLRDRSERPRRPPFLRGR